MPILKEKKEIKSLSSSQAKKNVNNEKKKVCFALQGGGAHGAFTWGVLDYFLEDGRFEIEGLSGSSAGAMNALAVCQGMEKGGAEGARKMLRSFWENTIEGAQYSSLKPGLIDQLGNRYTMYNTLSYLCFDMMLRFFSPYQFNPFDHDPLKNVIEKTFDFDVIQKAKKSLAFICATEVQSGRLKVFSNKEMKVASVLASACLPVLHKAVDVDGKLYWDGGFVGNPAIFPLIEECESSSIIIIQLNPTHRPETPQSVTKISDRLNEISNNLSLMRELRAIRFISKLIDQGIADKNKIKRLNVHLIDDADTFRDLGFSSKLNASSDFIYHLFEEGRKTAKKWIDANFKHIGEKSTVDDTYYK